jgi:release factor glutamine methyltransferase
MMSLLLDEVALAAARLAEAGVESPRADAELIAASVHRVRRGELHTVPDSAFDARFWSDIARRAAREPLQHITGQAHFRYLELEVGPGVFVPRPETEVMTGWAIDRLGEMDVAEPVVADLGTRSRPTRWPGPGPSATSPGTSRATPTPPGGSCCTRATSATCSANSTVRLTS